MNVVSSGTEARAYINTAHYKTCSMYLSLRAFQSKLTKPFVFVGGFILAVYVNFSPLS